MVSAGRCSRCLHPLQSGVVRIRFAEPSGFRIRFADFLLTLRLFQLVLQPLALQPRLRTVTFRGGRGVAMQPRLRTGSV